MRGGATAFLTKPVDGKVLLGAVRDALELDRAALANSRRLVDLRRRFGSLIVREAEEIAC